MSVEAYNEPSDPGGRIGDPGTFGLPIQSSEVLTELKMEVCVPW